VVAFLEADGGAGQESVNGSVGEFAFLGRSAHCRAAECDTPQPSHARRLSEPVRRRAGRVVISLAQLRLDRLYHLVSVDVGRQDEVYGTERSSAQLRGDTKTRRFPGVAEPSDAPGPVPLLSAILSVIRGCEPIRRASYPITRRPSRAPARPGAKQSRPSPSSQGRQTSW